MKIWDQKVGDVFKKHSWEGNHDISCHCLEQSSATTRTKATSAALDFMQSFSCFQKPWSYYKTINMGMINISICPKFLKFQNFGFCPKQSHNLNKPSYFASKTNLIRFNVVYVLVNCLRLSYNTTISQILLLNVKTSFYEIFHVFITQS